MSESMVRGRVHVIEDTKTFGQKGFRKRLVVLEQDNGRFVNYVPLEFIGDACDSVDSLNLGDDIEANFRLSGRKWQKDSDSEVKYFLSAEAMSFRMAGAGAPKGPTSKPNQRASVNVNDALAEAAYDDGEDIPF